MRFSFFLTNLSTVTNCYTIVTEISYLCNNGFSLNISKLKDVIFVVTSFFKTIRFLQELLFFRYQKNIS